MSNVAVIFAGGTGQRMNTRTRPKQFLELHGRTARETYHRLYS